MVQWGGALGVRLSAVTLRRVGSKFLGLTARRRGSSAWGVFYFEGLFEVVGDGHGQDADGVSGEAESAGTIRLSGRLCP